MCSKEGKISGGYNNDVGYPDRVDQGTLSDSVDQCDVSLNGGSDNVYDIVGDEYGGLDGGGHVTRWTDNMTNCDSNVVKEGQSEAPVFKDMNIDGGLGLCNFKYEHEGGELIKKSMMQKMNMYDVESSINRLIWHFICIPNVFILQLLLVIR